MKIFTEDEIAVEFNLQKNELSLICDILKYIVTRRLQYSHADVINELAKLVHEIWTKADCCPSSTRSIKRRIEGVWDNYNKVLKEGPPGRRHRAKPKLPKVPSRRSSRHATEESSDTISIDFPVDKTDEIPPEKKVKLSANTRSKEDDQKGFRDNWDTKVGNQLFDVKSDETVKSQVQAGYCFDLEFYEDQKSIRSKVMKIGKVTKEFLEEEKRRNNKRSRQYLRTHYAYGLQNEPHDEEVECESDTAPSAEALDQQEFYEGLENSPNVSSPNTPSIIQTRNQSKLMDRKGPVQLTSIGTQHQSIPKVPTKQGQVCDPKYLQAIGIMMSDGLSAPSAIRACFTLDTIVHGQDRFLPLNIDKEYKAAYSKLKKLQKQQNSRDDVSNDIVVELESDEECSINEYNLTPKTHIDKLKSIVEKRKEDAKKNSRNTLPDPYTARRNHYLMSVFVEGKIAEEMSQSEGSFIIPDGTTRNKVGELAAMLIKVGDNMRAVKAQQLGKGDRVTWADTIVHMLQRLSTASNTDIKALWSSIRSILSDLCKVNKQLGSEIKGIIGSDWEQGQLFCVLYYVLAVPEAIKQVFSKYQDLIGSDKLFPETTGFEMNVNEKIMVVQLLDIWMRLTSIRWHGRAWNKYELFTLFAEKLGYRNVGHMIHANRFGEFEERCAGGVYLAEILVKWLESYQSIRNSLSCYLRSVIGLMSISVFQWCAAALIGFHLTTPFMSMIIDHKVTQRQLLVILPKLYSELDTYPNSFIRFDKPALSSLSKYWLPPFDNDTSPYGVDVMRKLESV